MGTDEEKKAHSQAYLPPLQKRGGGAPGLQPITERAPLRRSEERDKDELTAAERDSMPPQRDSAIARKLLRARGGGVAGRAVELWKPRGKDAADCRGREGARVYHIH
jgi:hypothetical protein